MRAWSVLPLLLTAALAGCASNDVAEQSCSLTAFDVEGVRIVEPSFDPIDDNIDNATLHESYNMRTCSLPPIGHSALSPDGIPPKYIGEIDMRADLGLGAVAVLGNGEAPGVYVLDITAPAEPAVLSYIAQTGTYVTDVKWSDDGAVLYVASQSLAVDGLAALPAPTAGTGFTVYGMEDPAAPRHMGTVVDPQFGCHMLDPVQVAPTQDAVFCVSQHIRNYLIERGPAFANLGFVDWIPARDGAPVPAAPPVVNDPTCSLPTGCLLAQRPHDVTAYHEGGRFGEGRSYAVVSHWGEGVRVLDMTDAPVMTEVGSWTGEGAEHYAGNVHTAVMFDTAEGRFILASPEYTGGPGAETPPSLWLLNADDLGDLRLVAEWTHPGLHPSQGLYLTTHQWQVAPTGTNQSTEDMRVYLSYNHAGIWVLDLGAILAGDDTAAILGYNLARPPLSDDAVANAILSTWDVNVADGYIYGSDRATGLWVFHYEGDILGDERLRGFA